MDRQGIRTVEDIYRKMIPVEQTDHFKKQIQVACGEDCRVYLFSNNHFIADKESQEVYADVHDFDISFLEKFKEYVNEQGFLYFFGENIPEEVRKQLPQTAKTALWYPVVKGEKCHGFIGIDSECSDGFSSQAVANLNLLCETISFFLVACLQQNEITSSIDNLSSMLDELGTFLYIIDAETLQITYASEGLKERFPSVAKPGIKCYQAICGLDHEKPCDFCPIIGLQQSDQLAASTEVFMPEVGGWLKATARYFENAEENKQILVALNDISEVKQKELAIEKVAYRDQLLNIYNRVAFTRDLTSMVEQRMENVYALLIDIEDFKQLNDLFGFETGNVLLKAIVTELESLEMSEYTYRFGGGQFCVLMQNADVLQAVTLVRSFLARFENGLQLGDKVINVNINTAIVSNKDGEFSVDNFVSKIECAIEEVKNNVSNFLILGKPMEDKMRRTNIVKQVIKNTLDQGNIIIVYQPIYNIQRNCFIKAEALARIYDEELGWVSPGEFIPLAEKMGRIHDLDMMVLERVCQQMNEMKKKGIHFSSIHVNISVAQLVEKDFVEQVIEMIDKYKIPHEEIELEVTESTLFTSMELGENIIKKFKAQGITASLDDFGTGYSSLDYVINLPFHTLKINMSLIKHIVDSERFRKMVKYIIRIAKDFDMSTIAEGVETFEQYCILKDLECDNIQGFYFAKPMLKDQIIKKIMFNPQYCDNKEVSAQRKIN